MVIYRPGMANHEVLVLIDPNPPSRFQGIARLAGECGWHLRVEQRDAPPRGWTGDGVLAMVDDIPALVSFVRSVRRRGVPVVDMLENVPGLDVARVAGDNQEIGRLAARHFAERDFRNAAFFSVCHNHSHEMRLEGFREVWNGTPVETWLWPDVAGAQPGDWRRMNAWLDSHLRASPRPLAVFAWNDYDSTHVLSACRRSGIRVPDDVAIIGVDDNRIICEHQGVPLSSIAHDHERVGYTGAATLERLILGGKPGRMLVRVRPRGVVTRASTDTFAVNDPELLPAIGLIRRNLAHPFGAAQLAEALGMSRIRLDRLFAARLGRSVGSEIARRRIAEAKRLLVVGGLTLQEVAARCGYCHSSFLIKSFKKATGETPAAWRRHFGQ